MKALIFAAGYGTRLKPVTDQIPKALVPIGGKTLLEHTINRLIHFGFNDIIINVHHFAKQLVDYVESKKGFDAKISFSDETGFILDTGGGLLKTAWFFTDDTPFLVTNVDLVTNINLKKFYDFHLSSGGLVSLAVQSRESSRKFLFNQMDELSGWEDRKSGTRIITREMENYKPMSFNGMHVIDPVIFRLIQETGRFSIIDLYLRLSANERLLAYSADYFWMDVGKPGDLEKAEQLISDFNTPVNYPGLFTGL